MKKRRSFVNPIVIDTLRTVKKTFLRFLAILFMTMLGSTVFIGLVSIGPNMRKALEEPLKRSGREHISISSPLGLYDEDLQIIDSIGASEIEYQKSGDFLFSESGNVIRIISMPEKIGLPEIIKGRAPEKSGELLLDSLAEQNGYHVGDTIELEAPEEESQEETEEDVEDPREETLLKNRTYTIVGLARSPYYLAEDVRGDTRSGNGRVDCFGYVLYDDFLKERPFAVYLTLPGFSEPTYAKAYKNAEDMQKNRIQDLFADRPKALQEEIKGEGLEKLADAEQEIADGYKELDDAKEELADAKKKIDDGQEEYDKGVKTLEEELQKGRKELSDARRTLADGEEKLAEGKQKYSEGFAEYQRGKEEFLANKEKLDNAKAEIDAGRAELSAEAAKIPYTKEEVPGKIEELEEKKNGLLAQKEELLESDRTLREGLHTVYKEKANLTGQKEEIQKGREALNGLDAQIAGLKAQNLPIPEELLSQRDAVFQKVSQGEAALPEINAGIETLSAKALELEGQQKELKNGLDQINDALEEINGGISSLKQIPAAIDQIREARKELDKAEKQWESGFAKYEAGKKELDGAKKELDAAKATLDANAEKVEAGRRELRDGEQTFEREKADGEKKLADAKKELDDGRKEYLEGKEEYDREYPKAVKDLEEAQEKVDDLRDALDRIHIPSYQVAGRYNDYTINTYIDGSENMDRLTLIFPTVFYLIAMLITLTTVTRMVEEERSQIGTLKALGYENRKISSKYLNYALLSSALGSLLGVFLGFYLMTPVIFKAYSAGLSIAGMDKYILNPLHVVLVFVVGVLLTFLAAYWSVKRTLSQRAAELMRPKTPKRGNRIFLEKITPLWRRMNFMAKVTLRNITARKSRMFMTLLGVLGCSALIIMGIGLKNSVQALLDKQYTELERYDAQIVFDPDATDGEKEAMDTKLAEYDVEKSAIRLGTGTFKDSNGIAQSLQIIVPMDDNFSDFRILRDVATKESLTPDANGAYVTTGLTRELGKDLTELEIKDIDGYPFRIPVKGSTENFVGHILYLSPELYRSSMGEKAKANTYLVQVGDGVDTDLFLTDMQKEKAVLFTMNIGETQDSVKDLLDSLNVVVFLITAISTFLAFIVLFNLTNLNVSERLREISTIKVLGFSDREVTDYIYRESIVLTILGILLGVGFGKILHLFITIAIAPTHVIIDPYLAPIAYLLGGAITLVFSLLVMGLTHRDLKRVDMVEALKGAD